MSDETWEEQFKRFLQKTGDDFRRAGEDVKAEAQRLVDAAMDPEKQQKVRARLTELGVWARKTAHGVAGAVEEAAGKAETAFHTATEKVSEKVAEMKRGSSTFNASSPARAAPAPGTARKASKTKGKSRKSSKGGGKRKP